MSAAQRMRMRNNLADVESHFEQSLQELNAIKRGSAGRSAHVHDFVVEGSLPCFISQHACCKKLHSGTTRPSHSHSFPEAECVVVDRHRQVYLYQVFTVKVACRWYWASSTSGV